MKIKNVRFIKEGEYYDLDSADWVSECWESGHSFFCYNSDSIDALSSCCRLRNAIEENVFSYTLGAGGIETGSKCVITLNLNRIVQNWDREGRKEDLPTYLTPIVNRVHAYLHGWNDKLWTDFNNDMLPVYKAGFIELDKQFLTVGVNGFLEAAEYLGIEPNPENKEYQKLALDLLGTIEDLNKKHRQEHLITLKHNNVIKNYPVGSLVEIYNDSGERLKVKIEDLSKYSNYYLDV